MRLSAESVRRRPLAWFYAISVMIVIATIPLFIITGAQEAIDQAFVRTGAPFNTDLITWARLVIAYPAAALGALLALLQVAAPDIAVAIVAPLAYGHKALDGLKRRLRFWAGMPWRRGASTWIAMLLVFATLSLATAALSRWALPVAGFEWALSPLSATFVFGLLTAMFLDGGALLEENGWRGFALPLLLQRFRPLPASVVLGLLWAGWHLPVKFDLALRYGAGDFLLMVVVLTVKFVLLTIIMTYFWQRAGQATLIAIAMHGLSNDSLRLGGSVASEAFADQLQYEVNLALPMLVVAAGLLLLTRGQLGVPAAETSMSPSTTARTLPQ